LYHTSQGVVFNPSGLTPNIFDHWSEIAWFKRDDYTEIG